MGTGKSICHCPDQQGRVVGKAPIGKNLVVVAGSVKSLLASRCRLIAGNERRTHRWRREAESSLAARDGVVVVCIDTVGIGLRQNRCCQDRRGLRSARGARNRCGNSWFIFGQ